MTRFPYTDLFQFLLELLFQSFPIEKLWLKTFRFGLFKDLPLKELNKICLITLHHHSMHYSAINLMTCTLPFLLKKFLVEVQNVNQVLEPSFAFDSCQDSFKCYILTCLICRINCFALNLTLSCRWTNVRMQFSHKSYITKIRNVIPFCAWCGTIIWYVKQGN